MANFAPVKQYILYCLDRAIDQHGLKPPFLDVGCGIGDVSAHLAARGFHGDAIDASADAIAKARNHLKHADALKLYHRRLDQHDGVYSTLLLMDVLEHIEDDLDALNRAASLLSEGGHLVIAVPSNPREWRWDDVFYGHIRRYSLDDLTQRLQNVGLSVVDAHDFTFPLFWLMRRIYTRIKPRPAMDAESPDERTHASSTRNAWEMPLISRALNKTAPLWAVLSRAQYPLRRVALNLGYEMLVIARKDRLG